MANRIKLRVLGITLAPYSSNSLSNPVILNGLISEDISFDVGQLQVARDTTTTERTAFPLALSMMVVKYVKANHFNTETIFSTSTQDQINSAANA